MPNQKRQTVGYRKLKLKKLLPQGLLGVKRDMGNVQRDIAKSYAGMAASYGVVADRAAAIDGERSGKIEGNNKGFRPTGGTSIRDRAYDRSGEKVYASKLETNLRADMQSLYEQTKDDPVALGISLTALHASYQKDHVYPGIAADFSAGFARLSSAYQQNAMVAFNKKQEAIEQADMLGRLNEQSTTLARRLESVDGNTEAGQSLITDALDQYEGEISLAVREGRMTPVAGESAIQRARRKTTVEFYTSQAEGLNSVGEIEAMRAQMKKDFTNGSLDRVDGDAWAVIEAKMDSVKRQLETRDLQAANALDKKGSNLAERIVAGYDPEPEEISEFIAEAQITNPEALNLGMSKIAIAEKIAGSDLNKGADYIRELENTARKSGKEEDLQLALWAGKSFDRLRSEVHKNPIAMAVARGVIEDAGDLTLQQGKSADDYAGEFSARVAAAEAAAQYWGVPVKILKEGEARMIRDMVDSNPVAGIDIAEGLIIGGGEQAAQILTQLKGDAPKISQVGQVMLMGGSRQAALDVLRGVSKGLDGKRRPTIKRELLGPVANEIYGDAFIAHQEDGHISKEAAHNITRARVVDMGLDPKDMEDARPVYERALQEAAGATFDGDVQYGGIGEVNGGWFSTGKKVIVPSSMRADRFDEVIDSLRDEDFRLMAHWPVDGSNKPYPASTFHSAVPVAVAGGYRFATGDPTSASPLYIRGDDGQPFVLNIEAMREVLGVRVPGAWR